MRKAAQSDSPFKADAALALGRIYRDGHREPEVKPDADLAEKWLGKAADAKHLEAVRALAEFHLSAKYGKRNYARARALFVELDKLGDPSGAYYLGQMSEKGWGVKKDMEQALGHYKKAAGKKAPGALYRLAAFYEEGLGGLDKDEGKAMDHYRHGAELGHPICMFNLSVMLDRKDGDAASQAEAIAWLLRAASAGLPEAEYVTGIRYQSGRGMAQDFIAAAAWFDRAARSGHALAQLHLGEMYENGQGLKRDPRAARRLFELSAHGGDTGGMIKFAVMLANGIGGEQDLSEAFVFAESAATAAPDNEIAVKVRNDVRKAMTPEQIAEGKKRLTEKQSATKKE